MREEGFDVLVVGAGPAGVFAALELSQQPSLRIATLEKGPDMDHRRCPSREKGGSCRGCPPCAIFNGWGGAGAPVRRGVGQARNPAGAGIERPSTRLRTRLIMCPSHGTISSLLQPALHLSDQD